MSFALWSRLLERTGVYSYNVPLLVISFDPFSEINFRANLSQTNLFLFFLTAKLAPTE
jgi:hypothetical protein